MTEAEAKAKLQEVKNETFTKFCPLLKSECNNNCVCLVEAHIRHWQGEWYAYSSECGNAMFDEHRNCDVRM